MGLTGPASAMQAHAPSHHASFQGPPPDNKPAFRPAVDGQPLSTTTQFWRDRPGDCPAPLWSLILQECGEECLQGLRPHSGVVAALAVELAAVGEGRLRPFLRHLDEVHRGAGAVARSTADARNVQAHYKEEAAAAAAQLHACRGELKRHHAMHEDQFQAANLAASELDRAKFQIEMMSQALEQANRRLVDASAHWEHQLAAERERAVSSNVSIRDEFFAMQRALVAERQERKLELQKARDMAARLDATTEEFYKKGHEVAAFDQRANEAHRSAEFTVAQMEDWMRKTLGLWQRNREQEVGELKRRLELVKLGGVGGVSSEEADRSLLLVASLWHAAGRKAPPDITAEENSRTIEGALNSWRVYFHREVGSEVPLLRPTSSIILSPLRVVAGTRTSEVMAGELPSVEPSSAMPPAPPSNSAACGPL